MAGEQFLIRLICHEPNPRAHLGNGTNTGWDPAWIPQENGFLWDEDCSKPAAVSALLTHKEQRPETWKKMTAKDSRAGMEAWRQPWNVLGREGP